MKSLYLCDIDGTLADISHRLHFIKKELAKQKEGFKPDWKGFFEDCINDKPIPEVIETIRTLAAKHSVVMVTGRSVEIILQTHEWLTNNGVPFQGVYMRKKGDYREDYIVKAEMLGRIKEDFKGYEILGAFEDRQQVVNMYREHGIRVYQVAEGDF